MQIGQSSASFPLRFEPNDARGTVLSPEQQAKRTLSALTSERLFKDNQQALSGRSALQTSLRSRTPLYQQVERDLSDLRARLGDFDFANGAAGFQTAGVTSVTSARRLDLGDGLRVESRATTTYQPPAIEATLDPNAKLSTQPFTNAIQAGTLSVTFRVNGGAATTRNVAINPNTDTLNSVLSKLSNLTVGTQKPLTASFDAASGEINLAVNSTRGSQFDFTFGADSSGFLAAIGADGVDTAESLTAVNAIATSTSRTKYYRLDITVEGAAPISFTNLQVSSAALTRDQKVDELVTQLNAGLGGTGLVATNAGGGKIGFASADASAPLRPDLGVRITQTSRSQALSLGFQTSGSGGFRTSARITLDPELTSTTPAPTTSTRTIDTTVGGALGTGATLRELAGQLGLQAANGRYELEVNGRTLGFSEDQSLDEVLAGFSAAGATARYDADTQRITVTSADGRALSIADEAGNLAGRLGIGVGAASDSNDRLAKELTDFIGAVDDLVGLLEANTSRGKALEDDPLLQDLQAALGGLFAADGKGGLDSLADIGITREGGELAVDQARLAQLVAERPGELNRFLGTFFGERVDPLVRAGVRALQDAGDVASAEARAAAQAVKVRGELARLQARQQMLALERLNYEDVRERLEKQDEQLQRTAQELERRLPSGRPEDLEEAARLARRLGPDRSGLEPSPILSPGAAGLVPGTGLTSFGLSTGTTA